MNNNKLPLETHGTINLDHPAAVLFRISMLEIAAKAEDSDLSCPTCRTNLPYNHITAGPVHDGHDANFNNVYRIAYFCPICQEYFEKNEHS